MFGAVANENQKSAFWGFVEIFGSELNVRIYTILQNKRRRWLRAVPPPPIIFEP